MKMKVGKLVRDLLTEEVSVIDASNRVEFSFSSDFPVERMFGMEILSHASGAMDLSRAEVGAIPFLWNHDPEEPIGMIKSAKVVNGRGVAVAEFFSTECAQEKKQQMIEGLKNISFGYQIDEMRLLEPSKNGSPAQYEVTKFSVYEISLVSIPADYRIGVGRSDAEDGKEISIIGVSSEVSPESTEPQTQNKGELRMDIEQLKKEAMEAERSRIAAINALGDKFEKRDLARQLIEGGKSVDDAHKAFLEAIGSAWKPVTQREAEIGMGKKEIRAYSFMRALNALANPMDKRAQEAASFELEVSNAAQKHTGKSARGFLVPFDVLSAKRDLVVGTSTLGGNLVATEELGGSFIDILRKSMVMMAAGARTLTGLKGSVAIPRMTGTSTAYWIAEGGSPTESMPSFDQVTMQPRTVGAYVDVSRKLLIQSSVDVEAMVRDDIAKVMALEIDRAAMYGLGASGEPLGLKNHSGTNTKSFGSSGAPTFAEIVDLETKCATANAMAANMKYLFNAKGRGYLKSTPKVSAQPIYLMDGNMVNGYDALVSNQIIDNDFIFGDFSQLVLGFWSGLDLTLDNITQATSGTIRVIGLQDMDTAVRHPESFCFGS